jgi:hypothetical protein
MQYQAMLQRQYTDLATVLRYQKVKRGAETVLDLAEVYTGIACRISQTSLAKNGQTEVENKIQYDAKLFCSIDHELQQGDVVIVTRGAGNRRYIAGEPFLYRTHQEINLIRKERA